MGDRVVYVCGCGRCCGPEPYAGDFRLHCMHCSTDVQAVNIDRLLRIEAAAAAVCGTELTDPSPLGPVVSDGLADAVYDLDKALEDGDE